MDHIIVKFDVGMLLGVRESGSSDLWGHWELRTLFLDRDFELVGRLLLFELLVSQNVVLILLIDFLDGLGAFAMCRV